jgi:hypothetical protein
MDNYDRLQSISTLLTTVCQEVFGGIFFEKKFQKENQFKEVVESDKIW